MKKLVIQCLYGILTLHPQQPSIQNRVSIVFDNCLHHLLIHLKSEARILTS